MGTPNSAVSEFSQFERAAWKSEFTYDGRMRCRVEKNFAWTGSAWQQTNEVRFVYDGNVIVQHRDANNLPTLTLTRGLDLSGPAGAGQGAGGIGGLLAMSESSAVNAQHSYFHSDGNGNVTMLINGLQLAVAKYTYDPFGNTLSISGPKALVNRYRFSSKPVHDLSGTYDFLYRRYLPDLQRWLNRDPIEELDGVNLYGYVGNSPVGMWDFLGLRWVFLGPPIGSIWIDDTPPPLPPYTTTKNNNGVTTITVRKCNVLVFYGHGLEFEPGTQENWGALTARQLNRSDVPPIVNNEPCSSAEVFGCNTGHFVKIQNPTTGAVNPTEPVMGNITADIDGLWHRARAQARAICQNKENCCDKVTITFEYREPWYQRPSDATFHAVQTEVIKCK
jgi:RHS repeat-associated protein